jgi:hypothetical protein
MPAPFWPWAAASSAETATWAAPLGSRAGRYTATNATRLRLTEASACSPDQAFRSVDTDPNHRRTNRQHEYTRPGPAWQPFGPARAGQGAPPAAGDPARRLRPTCGHRPLLCPLRGVRCRRACGRGRVAGGASRPGSPPRARPRRGLGRRPRAQARSDRHPGAPGRRRRALPGPAPRGAVRDGRGARPPRWRARGHRPPRCAHPAPGRGAGATAAPLCLHSLGAPALSRPPRPLRPGPARPAPARRRPRAAPGAAPGAVAGPAPAPPPSD